MQAPYAARKGNPTTSLGDYICCWSSFFPARRLCAAVLYVEAKRSEAKIHNSAARPSMNGRMTKRYRPPPAVLTISALQRIQTKTKPSRTRFALRRNRKTAEGDGRPGLEDELDEQGEAWLKEIIATRFHYPRHASSLRSATEILLTSVVRFHFKHPAS